MAPVYDFAAVEKKWSALWHEQGIDSPDLASADNPYYNLMMFPYPSAEGLHIGNVYAFVGSDIHARFMRQQGHTVFEPIGFDAFGIHSENYALKIGVHPNKLIPQNIANFTRQLKRIGNMFDWNHVVSTTDAAYYKWTQWIFVKMFKAGLAYRKEAPVNWCPGCKTVLANEQVIAGQCERCSSTVERKNMFQWFFRITKYTGKLLADLAFIDWSETTKTAQRNWIGKSEGALIDFTVSGGTRKLTVFTTRPDTLFGATYLVLSPMHPDIQTLITPGQAQAVTEYRQFATQRAKQEPGTQDKTGVFSGSFAINPGNQSRIPIWIADYVLMDYGTGAIMGVPAHDTRDFDFAKAYHLPIIPVVQDASMNREPLGEAYTGTGTLINSNGFDGLDTVTGGRRIVAFLEERGCGKETVHYRLHDWCISRQRYWGPPIPVIHCDRCGVVPVPEEDLPVELPYLENFVPDGSGKSPLAYDERFVNTTCPACKGPGRRETDVSDNFLDSAWYFFRYPCSDDAKEIFNGDIIRKWCPVAMYIGGNEHAVLHLMYTRFITMVFHDLGLIDFDEPFKRFRAHGLIIKDGAKMSKSRGNVVNPDAYLERYGADTLRTYLMFLGPYEEGGDFRDTGIMGIKRFLDRIWRYITEHPFTGDAAEDAATLSVMHEKIKQVTSDYSRLQYNTAIARIMELLNFLTQKELYNKQWAKVLLQLTAPFAPFITQELWTMLGEKGMIVDAPWPQYDESKIKKEMAEIVITVNGKIRQRIQVPTAITQEELETAVFQNDRIQEWIRDKEIVKKIYVPLKLYNIVVR